MTLEEAIEHCQKVYEDNLRICDMAQDVGIDNEIYKQCALEHKQLEEWLRKLQKYEFEISECKAILDNPTPDVTENDKKRAMYVLQTFPDKRSEQNHPAMACMED